jgi:hypothetical protein
MRSSEGSYYPSSEIKRTGVGVEVKRQSWIEGIIDPKKLEMLKLFPTYEGHSTEYIIMQTLLAKKVESGPGMDPDLRARLSNLITAFRIINFPNLTPEEQSSMRYLASAKGINWPELRVDEINPELTEDVRWIWNTFNLKIPTNDNSRRLLTK